MTVTVWWATTGGERAEDWPELVAAAEPVTRARLDRLRLPEDRAAVLLAHTAARLCAAERFGTDPTEVGVRRNCPVCGATDHGRPEAVAADGRRLELSISHTRVLAMVAVAEVPVGVDVERVGRVDWDELADQVLSAAERRMLARAGDRGQREGARLWSRKEALTKLAGSGLATALPEVDVSGVQGTGGPVDGPAPGWVRDLAVTDDHVAAVATPMESGVRMERSSADELRARLERRP